MGDDDSSTAQRYAEYKRPTEQREIVTNEKGEKGWWSTMTDYVDNNPQQPHIIRRWNILSDKKPEPLENVTEWPPQVGKLFKEKGPIIMKDGKYGYFHTYKEGYGDRVDYKEIFIEIEKPLSKDEQERQNSALNSALAERSANYETNGPTGAPKVLAAVHVAHKQIKWPKIGPYVPAGSFVLAFYKLQFRSKDRRWYYTRLFNEVSVKNDSDIATRFDRPLSENDEFIANYEEYGKNANSFLADDFLQSLFQSSQVTAMPGEKRDTTYIGRPIALIGFDCADFNIKYETMTTYPQNTSGGMTIVPVKLSNPRVIHVSKNSLTYVLNMLDIDSNMKYLFQTASLSPDEINEIEEQKHLLTELKKEADELTNKTNEQLKAIDQDLVKIDNQLKTAEIKANESKKKIDEREQIEQKGKNWHTVLKETKLEQAAKFLPPDEYETAKQNVENFENLKKRNEELINKRSDVINGFQQNEKVKQYRELAAKIQTSQKNPVLIFYGYTQLKNPNQPKFFIDPDFTLNGLIYLVSTRFSNPQGGKRKSKKSIKYKKSMKAKRTIKRIRKQTKKYRRRSHRK